MDAKRIVFCAAAWVSLASSVMAQVVEKKTLTLDGARAVLAACEAEAAKNMAAGVIAVVDDGGNLIALHRLDGSFAAGANISIGKARTAAMFKRPTKVFEDIIKNGRTSMVALNDFTPLQGGMPIMIDGQVVGAVGVSGAASAQQDEEIAMAGATSLSGQSSMAVNHPPAAAEVTFFDHEHVASSFSRGEPLFAGSNAERYAIHTSRRDRPGQAEVHHQETDVIYIQDGAATLVTGGTVVDPKETVSGELRGSGIDGGQARMLAKGDVIIVPAGVPHWFKQVEGKLLYYVVKVRS